MIDLIYTTSLVFITIASVTAAVVFIIYDIKSTKRTIKVNDWCYEKGFLCRVHHFGLNSPHAITKYYFISTACEHPTCYYGVRKIIERREQFTR